MVILQLGNKLVILLDLMIQISANLLFTLVFLVQVFNGLFTFNQNFISFVLLWILFLFFCRKMVFMIIVKVFQEV